ncbi:MAG: hypothetical protein LC775_13420, partial [Acidobacteria bacterium]|nr:hypothetical protein [Acidobacteriota bacterium]
MEHHDSHPPEGGDHHNEEREKPTAPADLIYEQLTDEQRIQRGIADAFNEGQAIDDATARRIAAQLHTGQDSALYALASSGALDERLERELLESVQDTPPERDSWIDALLDYADARGEDRGPREGWAGVTKEMPGQTDVATEKQLTEEVREAAAEQYARDHQRFQRFVAAGIRPDGAEVLVEFVHFVQEQRAEQAAAASGSVGETVTASKPTASDTAQLGEAAPPPGTDTHREPVPPGADGDTPENVERLTSPEAESRLRPRIYVRCMTAYT